MDEKISSSPPPVDPTSASKDDGGEGPVAKTNSSTAEKIENYCEKKPLRSFPDLPMIVMEYILAHFSYFEVLQLRLISTFWDNLIKKYLDKADEVFQHNLARHNVQWLAVKEVIEDFKQSSEESISNNGILKKRNVPKMSPRYHHCACYVNESMYVFGGCIAPNTAYNDLWRFDMVSKRWHRIIAAGTPPLPRLFCSFTPYEKVDDLTGERRQYIVLFGGFLFDEKLNTRDRLLGTIHLYDIAQNRWTLLPISTSLEGKSNQQQQLLLKSGNHSAVIIGDELIVFNGLRYVTNIGEGSFQEVEVPCNQVYAFYLKANYWRRVDNSPADQPGHHHQVSPRMSVRCPLNFDIRSTLEATQPMNARRKAATQTPVALDAHNILYICGCSTNVLFIAAFLLMRERCHEPNCELCLKEDVKDDMKNEGEEIENNASKQPKEEKKTLGVSKKQKKEENAKEPKDTRWKWVPVEISREGLDFEFTYGVEFCKVGNMMAYLTAKDVAVPVRRPPPLTPPKQPQITPPKPPHPSQSAPSTSSSSLSSSAAVFPPIPPLHHIRSREHISTVGNKQLLRERRIEALDYYHRQFQQLHHQQMLQEQRQIAAAAAQQNNNDNPPPTSVQGVATIPRHSESPTVHRSTLQLRLLDISRVITERRIDRVRQRHEMDYSVVPEALSAYSLVAAPDALLLFGGYYVHFNQPPGNAAAANGAVNDAGMLGALQIMGHGGGGSNDGLAVSSKLFMISSKPEMRLF